MGSTHSTALLKATQELLKQRGLKISDKTICSFFGEVESLAPWFVPTGSLTIPSWERLGRDIENEAAKRKLKPGTVPLWKLIRSCLKDEKCETIVKRGRQALEDHQDSMSEIEKKRGQEKSKEVERKKGQEKLKRKIKGEQVATKEER